MKTPSLGPCPYCGGTTHVRNGVRPIEVATHDITVFDCGECKATTSWSLPIEEAIRLFNSRKTGIVQIPLFQMEPDKFPVQHGGES